MHKQLAVIERAQIAGLGIAEADHAEKRVRDWIGNRYGVRELLGRVDAVAVAQWNIRIAGARRGLTCVTAGNVEEGGARQDRGNEEGAPHLSSRDDQKCRGAARRRRLRIERPADPAPAEMAAMAIRRRGTSRRSPAAA